jgi:hypothetical protein
MEMLSGAFDFGKPRHIDSKEWELNEAEDRAVWNNKTMDNKVKTAYFEKKKVIYIQRGWDGPVRNCEIAIEKFGK